ncbi:MAG: sugar phosphate isomerase/epimerase family protein [Pseudomonadota bacterium]
MKNRIGFMQGRLSPLVDGKIQAFPASCWQAEFESAKRNGFSLMEWTLDQDGLYLNPLLTTSGQAEIRELRQAHGIVISSLTGDCFMQSPFWKAQGPAREALLQDFRAVAQACSAVGIVMMVVPLVDNGRLDNREQEDLLVDTLQKESAFLAALGVKVVFESDFGPDELARFIARLAPARFGINYDIGNSASLGMDPVAEISAYGERILNVHIKDRVLGGTTVPLGTGNANFDQVFAALARAGYQGTYILQTARAADGKHAEVLCRYRDMALDWIKRHGA